MTSQDHFSRRRNSKELLSLDDDGAGYIEGKVFMTWPPRNRVHRVNIEVAEQHALYRFELEVPHRDGISFRPHERVCFSLKGVRVDRRKESNAPHYLPIVLRFPDGVVLKYLSGVNAGKVVDTWVGNTDEWYDPGVVTTVSDAVTTDASEIHPGPQTTTRIPPQILSREGATNRRGDGNVNHPAPSLAAVDETAATQSTRQVQQPGIEKRGRSSKAKTRKRRRLHKEKELTSPNRPTNRSDAPPPADVAITCHEQTQPSMGRSLICTSNSRLNPNQVNGHANGEVTVRKDSVIDPSPQNTPAKMMAVSGEVDGSALKPGVRTERGDVFTALSDLQKGHSMINVIGIVTSVNPKKKTSTNEWGHSFTIIDPSTVDLSQQNVKVNCFQKKYSEWLPQVQNDDIVILRRLKIVEFHGALAGTGYGDRLRWAVYDPLKRSTRPPDKGNAPEKEAIDDGMGYEFSPYLEPFQGSVELEYCQQLGEWWQAWKSKHEPEVSNVSIANNSEVPRKRHLLISEASPDHPPDGFFNCTVEVLQRFNNPSGAASTVYVTDYTTNAFIHTIQATWCPAGLSDRVLQCNMWDDARSVAMMMNPGEYWYLYNARAKWNTSRYMEATMQLAEKVTRLDETRLETHPHLRALLARKSVFELNKSHLTPESPSLHTFPEMLLQDVDRGTNFLTCIVELLHTDFNSRNGHLIYVTDYTYNPDLPTTVATAHWAYNLGHRVVTIQLNDTQAEISLDLMPGSMYIIRNLRIKHSNASGDMHGSLGGEDSLIVPLHDLSSHHAQMLQRNKEAWKRENMLNATTTPPNGSHEEIDEHRKQSSAIPINTTLQEVLATPAPKTFRVSARVVDFFPFSLEDASALRCTKCGLSPPPSFKQCPRCDDMMETHTKWFYCLYILLQDEKGSELILSLSGKECTLLQDVDPTDFRCDVEAFNKFLSKLSLILGNLRDVHAAWSRNEEKVIQSPLMLFTLESWNVGDEKGYGLLNCIPT